MNWAARLRRRQSKMTVQPGATDKSSTVTPIEVKAGTEPPSQGAGRRTGRPRLLARLRSAPSRQPHAYRRTFCALLLAAIGALIGLSASSTPATASTVARAVPRAAASPLPSGALGNLLTYGYDNGRSADDPSKAVVTGLSNSPAWNDDALDGAVYGEPLVDGTTVYVATENDSIYALAAADGKVLWHLQVGTAVSTSVVDSAPTVGGGCGDIDPLGITGTPVIDPARNVLFAAEETEASGRDSWQGIRHWLVAISLTTHRELWHRDIDPPNANTADSYYIPAEQQRPAVTLANGRLYVPFGGLDGDRGQYHGYLVAVPESGVGPLESYQVPTEREGAIWGTGGTVVSAKGDLYLATGNGSSRSPQHFDEGDSVVELSPSLQRLGIWAPSNWVELNDDDWDLGSAGPIEVPGTTLLFAAGKPAWPATDLFKIKNGSFGYLMSEGHLEGIARGAYTGRVCFGGGVFGADASDILGSGGKTERVVIYTACGSGTEALEVNPTAGTFHRLWAASSGSPNGSPLVAGGIVWALSWDNSGLYGMDASTGRVLVERATEPLEHFVAPAAGDDMLFVPTTRGVEAFRALG